MLMQQIVVQYLVSHVIVVLCVPNIFVIPFFALFLCSFCLIFFSFLCLEYCAINMVVHVLNFLFLVTFLNLTLKSKLERVLLSAVQCESLEHAITTFMILKVLVMSEYSNKYMAIFSLTFALEVILIEAFKTHSNIILI